MILDDATSEIYYAQLLTVMAGMKKVIERKGVFCARYRDRGSHFWLRPKVGGEIEPHRLTQVGRALRELGAQMTPAYSPQLGDGVSATSVPGRGRLPQELRLAGITTLKAANAFLRGLYR